MRQVAESIEIADTLSGVDVQPQEYTRLLGYPRDRVLEGRAAELADWARDWYAKNGRPWFYARQAESVDLDEVPTRSELTASPSTASACIARSSRPGRTAQFWLLLARARGRRRGPEALERGEARRIFLSRSVCLGSG